MALINLLLRSMTKPKNILVFLGLQLLSKKMNAPLLNRLLLAREFFSLLKRAQRLRQSVKSVKKVKRLRE